MDETPQVYLLTARVLAESADVDVPLMEGFFDEQLRPNRDADPHRYWEVVDRTTGEVVDPARWDLDPESEVVHVHGVTPMHEVTVTFLAYIIWDPVEMYNHLTNDWGDKEHEIPFDIYHPATRRFVMDTFAKWLEDNPDVDVVRFTTFFYQFTLLFDQRRREKVVDWFGCSCTVSPAALDDFEQEYGYRLRPEDFVDGGAYNSAWRVPRKPQRDWIDFLSGFVRRNVKQMADMAHAAGKEAMMFLGDQWIGTEPYKDGFDQLGLDAVVGSIGDGTTTRMIADIPGVKYTEGRFLPYFFPDTFHEATTRASKASTTGARPAARSCARRSSAWAMAATCRWRPSSRSSWTPSHTSPTSSATSTSAPAAYRRKVSSRSPSSTRGARCAHGWRTRWRTRCRTSRPAPTTASSRRCPACASTCGS